MKENKVDIKPFLRQFYRGNGLWLTLAVVQTLLLTGANLLISWLIQQLIDLIGGVDTGYTLGQLGLFGLGSVALVFVCCGFSYVSKPRFMAKAIAQYKEYVFSLLTRKSISAFTGENTATYISALSNDVAAIEKGYLQNLYVILDQSVLFVGALGLMFWYNPELTLVSLGLALLPLLAAVLTGGLVAREEKAVSVRNETYMSTVRDALAGFSVVKSFQAEARLCGIFAREVRAVADAQQRRQKMSILVQGISAAAGVVLQLGVFLVGAWLALSGSGISAGSVLVFVQLMNYVLGPIGTIPQALAECKASKALVEKLAQALAGHVRQEGGVEKQTLEKGITLENLSFSYEKDKPVLQNVTFSFEAGKSYCLVGASGSGKSTLLNLLLSAQADFSGRICYDDVPIQQLREQALYSLVSGVQQNVFIFNATIRENITMFSEFPQEEVDRAIALSGISQLIAQRGEDYLCGENGCNLSGGEKQRLSIARSLLKEAKVLLVDEATAALDGKTAAQVMDAIFNLEGLTRVVVTHDLTEAELVRYDCILALKNGCLTETGSFRELMEQKGYFYSLYTVSQ